MGTAYVARLPDDKFVWLNSNEFGSHDPSISYKVEEGYVGEVISDQHHHDFAKVGERFKVFKVAYDVDYYGVLIDNRIRWFTGFQLARDI
jgi:hypothetical protein